MRIIALVLLAGVLSMSHCASLSRDKRSMNSPDYVMAPGARPLRLDDPFRQRMTETFSDNSMGLTVIKEPSDNFRACFITDLDPEFSLTTLEKLEIANSQEPLIINNPIKYRDFKSKAGPMITTLCSRLHIFWLNQPPPLMPLGQTHQIKNPPPLVKAPPSLVKAPPSLVRAPPSLNLANHNEVQNVAAPNSEVLATHVMRTPPPLHPAGSSHVIRTPPPLNKNFKAPPPL